MKYFSIAELTDSATARQLHINNKPDNEAVENLKALVENILDPARELMGVPVRVNSGYRSPRLNRVVGGVDNSQHIKGEAADVSAGSPELNRRLYEVLLDMPFDQLIWERGSDEAPAWLHVSYRRDGANRGEVLRL
ncbi:MAG: peptidase M15 [Bacteroidaceae bacterium]|nr:peptidase M15 [Bacteroidaceae bacterium]